MYLPAHISSLVKPLLTSRGGAVIPRSSFFISSNHMMYVTTQVALWRGLARCTFTS